MHDSVFSSLSLVSINQFEFERVREKTYLYFSTCKLIVCQKQ